jgi:hypothetical protein
MDARWMPLFAAAMGVFGAVAGALVGGSVANSGQEQGFERQRAAAIQDLRIKTYGDFLGTANALLATAKFDTNPEKQGKPYVALQAAEARVELIAETQEVESAASKVIDATEDDPSKTLKEQLAAYQKATIDFRGAARDEIRQTAE